EPGGEPNRVSGRVTRQPNHPTAYAVRLARRLTPMSLYFPTPDELSTHTIFPGVIILTAALEKMMLSVVDLAPHSVVEEHSHPHEQVGMLLEARATFFIGDEEKRLQAGDL